MMIDFDPNEVAFGSEIAKAEEVFKFDEPEQATPSSQEETAKVEDETKVESKEGTPSASDEDKDKDVEQRVPYTRFKKMHDERDSFAEKIKALETELASRGEHKTETRTEDMPEEWKLLYGDGEVSQKAWAVQQRREQKLREDAVKAAIDLVRSEQAEAIKAEERKEAALDSYLSSLKENLGTKYSETLEEELLSIVDEFSPVGEDGKYASLISPEKAIEIYNLREAKKTSKTKAAREKVVDLTAGKSQGEAEAPVRASDDRSWDAWRSAL